MKTRTFRIIWQTILIGILAAFTSSCAMLGGEWQWKSVCCFNASDRPICVTSLTGIQAYRKGRGPQNLGCGNLIPDGTASSDTYGDLRIHLPVVVQWTEGYLDDPHAGSPRAAQAVIREFKGLPTNQVVIRKEASLVAIFTGDEWIGIYVEGESNAFLVKDEMRALIHKGGTLN
jgi:hypothetical protein